MDLEFDMDSFEIASLGASFSEVDFSFLIPEDPARIRQQAVLMDDEAHFSSVEEHVGHEVVMHNEQNSWLCEHCFIGDDQSVLVDPQSHTRQEFLRLELVSCPEKMKEHRTFLAHTKPQTRTNCLVITVRFQVMTKGVCLVLFGF
jgi:hypothetical protein